MEENKNGFDELAQNIKSLIDKQTEYERERLTLKAEVTDQKELLKAINAKGGQRLSSSAPMTMQESISQEIGKNAGEIAKLSRKEINKVSFSIKTPSDMLPSAISGGSATISNVFPTVITPPPRPFHVWDALPVSPMSTSLMSYLKETSVDGGFSSVPGGSIKPQISMALQEVQAKAQVVAAWLRISTSLLEDISYLQNYLSYRMSENLLVKIDDLLLNGNGVDPNIGGILLAGNHTAKTGSATIFIEKLVEAIGQMAGYNRKPSVIILNPADFYSIVINKAVTSGDYSLPNVVSATQDGFISILGIPVVWSAAIASGNYLVADAKTGCMVWMRQSPKLELFYQDQDNVVRNEVTIRLETRFAFSVFSPLAFIAAS